MQDKQLQPGPTQDQLVEYQNSMERQLQVVEIQTDQGPVRLTPAIVRRYLAVGQVDRMTDGDITLFMAMCKFNGLNPFIREAWLIKYGDVASMIVSKDVFIKRAYETPECKDWQAGIIVWDPEAKKYYDTRGIIPPGHELLGGWCEVDMQDRPKMRLEVNLDEYVQYTGGGQPTKIWSEGKNRGKQATMIRKVALAQGLREAIPSRFKKMYIPDELGLDPDKMPEGAIDLDPIKSETGTSAAPANGKAETAAPVDDAPTGGLPRRSRRNKFTGLDKELFPGGKIETCGVKPEQLKQLKLLAQVPGNLAAMQKYMAENVGYAGFSYLREDEALSLAGTLIPVPVEEPTGTQEDVFDPPESAFTPPPVSSPVDDPVPVEGQPKSVTPEPEKVMCPNTGEVTFKEWCITQCRTRAKDQFCIALGEKPPKSGMFGGGA